MWEANEKHRSVYQQNRLIKYTPLWSASSEGSDRFTTERMSGTDVDIQRRRCVSRSGRAAMNKPEKVELNLGKKAESNQTQPLRSHHYSDLAYICP